MLVVRIRPASYQDLPALAAELGREHHFRDCLARQQAGRGILLVAFLADVPVGVVFLRLEPAEEPEVRERLAGVPLLQHLHVHRNRRGQLIATQLLIEAERLLRDAYGADQVALGVALESEAIPLYLRQGYREWRYAPIGTTRVKYDLDGTRHYEDDECRIMVKDLRGTGPVAPAPRAPSEPIESTVDEDGSRP